MKEKKIIGFFWIEMLSTHLWGSIWRRTAPRFEICILYKCITKAEISQLVMVADQNKAAKPNVTSVTERWTYKRREKERKMRLREKKNVDGPLNSGWSRWWLIYTLTLIFISLSNNTFSAFKSRCTTPLLWQYSTADTVWANTLAASSSFIRPLATKWSKISPRGAYSVTK